MARWKLVARVKSSPRSTYVGWMRQHPNIHMGKEPMSKMSLVQVHQDGDMFTILGQTVAHGIFSQPLGAQGKIGTQGKILFKKTSICRSRKAAMIVAVQLKKQLAQRYDGVTRHFARVSRL